MSLKLCALSIGVTGSFYIEGCFTSRAATMMPAGPTRSRLSGLVSAAAHQLGKALRLLCGAITKQSKTKNRDGSLAAHTCQRKSPIISPPPAQEQSPCRNGRNTKSGRNSRCANGIGAPSELWKGHYDTGNTTRNIYDTNRPTG